MPAGFDWFGNLQTTWRNDSAMSCSLTLTVTIIIGPESDHWLCLSLTDWLTDLLTYSIRNVKKTWLMWPWCVRMPTQNLLRLLLLLMLMLRIMLANVCYRFGSWCLVLKLNFFQTLSTRVGQDFEVEVQAKFWSWILFIILLLMFSRGYEVESFFNFKFSGDADVWLIFLADA